MTLRRLVLSLAALAIAAPAVAAQDLEVESMRTGIPLPAGYWERKAADPLAFELPNGLFGRRTNLPPVENAGLVLQRARRDFKGEARLPVILALFSDSPEPQFTASEIDAAVFSGPSQRGTFSEFYEEMSRGQFTVTGDVFPWVRTGMPIAEVVGSERGLGNDAKVGQYLSEAVAILDADVDWGLYDNDGPDGIPNSGDDDGIVDVVTLEYLEVSASCGGPSIWPHRYGISGWTGEPHETNDPSANGGNILVDGYITQGVTDCSGQNIQTAGTISHEYGHALGLPDYYHAVNGIDAVNRRWVIGCWGLMAAGSWGCGPVGSNRAPYGPIHMVAYSKWELGWLEWTNVPSDEVNARYDLGPVQTTGDALRIPLTEDGSQALLLEYRAHVGFDDQLPAAGVLAIRHDEGGALRPSSGLRYFLSLLEADGDEGLLRTAVEGGDRGVPGDVFGVRTQPDVLDNLSSPSTRTGDGRGTSVTLHEIAVRAGRAQYRLTTAKEPRLLPPDTPRRRTAVTSSETRIPIFGGVMPYTVSSSSLPEGLTLSTDRSDIVISGGLIEEGLVDFEVIVRDDRGSGGVQTFQLQVDPFVPTEALLIAPWLGGLGREATEIELRALDAGGNANGSYDVGDLRAWLFGG